MYQPAKVKAHIKRLIPHLPIKSPNTGKKSTQRTRKKKGKASTIERSRNPNPIAIAQSEKTHATGSHRSCLHHDGFRRGTVFDSTAWRGVAYLAGDAETAEGELPDAAATPPPPTDPPSSAALSRGVAWPGSPCFWRLSGDDDDPGGGGGGGGGCSCSCWPAKTTLLSNVDHFMVPTPHPPRRSRPDPADSPEFRRDPPPLLLSSHPPSSYHQQQQKIASSSFPSPRARASRLPPPLVASLLLLLLLFLLVFFLSLACNNYFFSFFSPFCFLLFSHAPPRYLVFLDDALFLPLSFSLCLVCNLCVYCAIWWVIWLLSFLVHFCVFFFYCEKKMALWVTSLTRLY